MNYAPGHEECGFGYYYVKLELTDYDISLFNERVVGLAEMEPIVKIPSKRNSAIYVSFPKKLPQAASAAAVKSGFRRHHKAFRDQYEMHDHHNAFKTGRDGLPIAKNRKCRWPVR
ncbi:MAG: hypothetical protein ABIG30_03265 [Candidatus Aenigmatarchaeota archaeon]